MAVVIYVYLLNEGTDVWRPVVAEHVRDDVYPIIGQLSDGTENWEFLTGDVVRCRARAFSGGGSGLVAYEKTTMK